MWHSVYRFFFQARGLEGLPGPPMFGAASGLGYYSWSLYEVCHGIYFFLIRRLSGVTFSKIVSTNVYIVSNKYSHFKVLVLTDLPVQQPTSQTYLQVI